MNTTDEKILEELTLHARRMEKFLTEIASGPSPLGLSSLGEDIEAMLLPRKNINIFDRPKGLTQTPQQDENTPLSELKLLTLSPKVSIILALAKKAYLKNKNEHVCKDRFQPTDQENCEISKLAKLGLLKQSGCLEEFITLTEKGIEFIAYLYPSTTDNQSALGILDTIEKGKLTANNQSTPKKPSPFIYIFESGTFGSIIYKKSKTDYHEVAIESLRRIKQHQSPNFWKHVLDSECTVKRKDLSFTMKIKMSELLFKII